MSEPPGAPRRPAAGNTRDRILSAALEMFAARGFDATTVRAIADHCGLTDPALYYYFPTKRAILDALLQRSNEAMATRLRSAGDRALSNLERIVATTLDELAADGLLFKVILDQALDGDRTALALRGETAASWRRGLTMAFQAEDGDLVGDRVDAFMMLFHGATLSAHIDDGVPFSELERPEHQERIIGPIVAVLTPDPTAIGH